MVLIEELFRYLHEVCSPSIVHRNVKSANILLDAELSPHLSDSGLESFVPNADQVNLELNKSYFFRVVYFNIQIHINVMFTLFLKSSKRKICIKKISEGVWLKELEK